MSSDTAEVKILPYYARLTTAECFIRLQAYLSEVNDEVNVDLELEIDMDPYSPPEIPPVKPQNCVTSLTIRYVQESKPQNFLQLVEMLLDMFPNVKTLWYDSSLDGGPYITKSNLHQAMPSTPLASAPSHRLQHLKEFGGSLELQTLGTLARLENIRLSKLNLEICWSDLESRYLTSILEQQEYSLKALHLFVFSPIPTNSEKAEIPPLIFPDCMPQLETLDIAFNNFVEYDADEEDLEWPVEAIDYATRFPSLKRLAFRVTRRDDWATTKLNEIFLPEQPLSPTQKGNACQTVEKLLVDLPTKEEDQETFRIQLKTAFPNASAFFLPRRNSPPYHSTDAEQLDLQELLEFYGE